MLQAITNGLVQGLLFAVVGVAFSLVYATTGVFFIALGAIFALAPYLVLQGVAAGLPWPVGVALSVAVAAGLSVVCEGAIHRPLDRKKAPGNVHFIASLGAYLMLAQGVVLLWGPDVHVLRAGMDRVYVLGLVRLTWSQVVGAAGAGALLAVFFVGLRSTGAGLQLRALASNATLLATLGRDVRLLRQLAFAVAGALAAAASLLTALDVGFGPHVGLRTVLIGVAAAIVGGTPSFASVALAGVLIGLLRAQVVWHTSARWEDAATFALLALCLLLLPDGLQRFTGHRMRLETAP